MATGKTSKPGSVRNLRIRNRVFPAGASVIFDTSKGGYAPAPILLRKLLRFLKPTQLELLLYLMLRADEHALCYPTVEEIAHELGKENNISRLRRTIRELEAMGFIATCKDGGRMYFLVLDPRHAVVKLHGLTKLHDDDLASVNELLSVLKLQTVVIKKQP